MDIKHNIVLSVVIQVALIIVSLSISFMERILPLHEEYIKAFEKLLYTRHKRGDSSSLSFRLKDSILYR